MSYLLDTHALVWWLTDSPRLPATVRDTIEDGDLTVFVSVASGWEIATKARFGKLPEIADHVDGLGKLLADAGLDVLAVELPHALRAGGYLAAHRDPFDRLLAAQAEIERLTLLTVDPAFAAFPCATLW